MKFRDEQHKDDFYKKVIENKGKLFDMEKLLALVAKGLSQTEIADMFGVSRQAVNKALLKYKKQRRMMGY